MSKGERRKPKSPQRGSSTEVDGRDLFQTPNYAVDLLVPFLDKSLTIWECASGKKKIVNRLKYHDFSVFGTDLQKESPEEPSLNFLFDRPSISFDCIVTNTPFSIKKKFYEKCREYKVPFALLIPADYSGWIIRAVQDGAEKIVPTRRIDYITPNTLKRIHVGEVWEMFSFHYPNTIGGAKKESDLESEASINFWEKYLFECKDVHNYSSIYDAPAKLLRKYSSSYFHSMWLTWGLGLGKSETFVELTDKMKDEI